MKRYYRVAEHNFSLNFTALQPSESTLSPYSPFEVEECETLFAVDFVEDITLDDSRPILVDAELSQEGMVRVDVYQRDNGYQYVVFIPGSEEINSIIDLDFERAHSSVALYGSGLEKKLAMTNALILSYMNFTVGLSTLLLHSSTVIKDSRAYAFLGKSGTGKSTHSRMWLEAFSEAELLNDDHPIVRVHSDGKAIIYGSPWSGKTSCYRNLSAPLEAIVRIERASSNSVRKLSAIQALGSITTSCSGMQWSQRLINGKMQSLDALLRATNFYVVSCLPNNDAARVCCEFIEKNR